MDKSTVRDLQAKLLCSSCSTLLTSPCVLPCGHTFCKRCMQKKLYHRDFRCFDCGEFFNEQTALQTCPQFTELVTMFKKIVPDSGMYENVHSQHCLEHRNLFTYLCRKCIQLACGDCVLEKHEGHSPRLPINDESQIRNLLQSTEEEAKKCLDEIEKMAELLRKQSNESKAKAEQELKKLRQELPGKMSQDWRREQENQLQDRLDECSMSSATLQQPIDQLRTEAQDLQVSTRQLAEAQTEPIQCIRNYISIAKTLQDLKPRIKKMFEPAAGVETFNLELQSTSNSGTFSFHLGRTSRQTRNVYSYTSVHYDDTEEEDVYDSIDDLKYGNAAERPVICEESGPYRYGKLPFSDAHRPLPSTPRVSDESVSKHLPQFTGYNADNYTITKKRPSSKVLNAAQEMKRNSLASSLASSDEQAPSLPEYPSGSEDEYPRYVDHLRMSIEENIQKYKKKAASTAKTTPSGTEVYL